jgi:hypothetical protein
MAPLRILALLLAANACSYVKSQVDAQNVNGCIEKNCHDSEASAHTDCEAACRSTYGK